MRKFNNSYRKTGWEICIYICPKMSSKCAWIKSPIDLSRIIAIHDDMCVFGKTKGCTHVKSMVGGKNCELILFFTLSVVSHLRVTHLHCFYPQTQLWNLIILPSAIPITHSRCNCPHTHPNAALPSLNYHTDTQCKHVLSTLPSQCCPLPSPITVQTQCKHVLSTQMGQ